MTTDALNGCSAGLSELEAAVTSNWSNLFRDESMDAVEKMKSWWKPLQDWISSEPTHPLRALDRQGLDDPVYVIGHSTFGRLHAQVRLQCACTDGESAPNINCCLHGKEIALTDLLWEIIKVVHQVFDDKYMSFANVFFDETVKGQQING